MTFGARTPNETPASSFHEDLHLDTLPPILPAPRSGTSEELVPFFAFYYDEKETSANGKIQYKWNLTSPYALEIEYVLPSLLAPFTSD